MQLGIQPLVLFYEDHTPAPGDRIQWYRGGLQLPYIYYQEDKYGPGYTPILMRALMDYLVMPQEMCHINHSSRTSLCYLLPMVYFATL